MLVRPFIAVLCRCKSIGVGESQATQNVFFSSHAPHLSPPPWVQQRASLLTERCTCIALHSWHNYICFAVWWVPMLLCPSIWIFAHQQQVTMWQLKRALFFLMDKSFWADVLQTSIILSILVCHGNSGLLSWKCHLAMSSVVSTTVVHEVFRLADTDLLVLGMGLFPPPCLWKVKKCISQLWYCSRCPGDCNCGWNDSLPLCPILAH